MQDIVPELLQSIKDDFTDQFNESDVISKLYARVRDGTATHLDANEFAIEAGSLLADAYKRNISSGILPDGKMYFNIGKRVVEPTMVKNYNLITEVTRQIQTDLNKAANIGIKAIIPDINQDRINGILNRLAVAENYDDIAWILDETVKTFSQSIVDDFIKANAQFQYEAGMTPVIVRKSAGSCCDWCREVAGIYTYPKVPKDVYRRHQRCRCTVEYDPRDGKRQNVHTKRWRSLDEDEKIELRKSIGLEIPPAD